MTRFYSACTQRLHCANSIELLIINLTAVLLFWQLKALILYKNESYVLDHIFIFTESPEEAANSLQKFGLTEGAPNIHPGQGTSCRRFFFENAYLELVWVSSEEEIKSSGTAETKLWERSQYKTSHYCPFGICFRNTSPENKSSVLIFEDGWKYKPGYLPEGMYINIASNANFPAEPMLFEMPFSRLAPKDFPPDKLQSLKHSRGFKEITKVILSLPSSVENLSTAMQKVLDNNTVAVLTGRDFSISVEFDDQIQGEIHDFNPLVPLFFKW